MRRALLAGAALLLPAVSHAALVITIGQIGNADTLTATDNGSVTHIDSDAGATVNVTQDLGGFLGNAALTFHATSTDAAVSIGSFVLQHFDGSFSITNGATTLLSGSFTDAVFGSGDTLSVDASQPPESVTLASDVIPLNLLQVPRGISLSFANVTPGAHIDGSTLAAFTSGVAGQVSATATPAPEPASLAVLGLGLLGLSAIRRRD